MIKKRYEELQKKYTLPAYDLLNNVFEIETIDDDCSFLLREIRRKLYDIIAFYAKNLDELLHPESGAAMHESSQFTDAEREKMFSLYKKLKKLERMSFHTGLAHDDKIDAQFITAVVPLWNGILKELKGISAKLMIAWDVDVASEKDNGYFG